MSAPITQADWNAKLKHAQDQAQRATKAELARNYSEAFELYVRAGQLFVWLLGNFPSTNHHHDSAIAPSLTRGTALSTSSPPAADGLSGTCTAQSRQHLKQMATRVMARAEKIKATCKHLRPVDRDALSHEEQSSVLVSSSLINGLRYPIWKGPPAQLQNTNRSTFTQDAQPPLSSNQIRQGALYRRPSWLNAGEDQCWSTKLSGCDIVQDIVTDCSFVAALEAAAQHDRIFGGNLATSALYPQDSSGRIRPSANGQYHVKLHINGTPRVVLIDDHLPYYPAACPISQPTTTATATATAATSSKSNAHKQRLICASSRDGHAVWPALLEKAYLQVMGGYEFAGSNGSIDLYALTGWLPEHIFLRHAGFQRERSWTRFHTAWNAGQCMATAGTGKAPPRKQRSGESMSEDSLATITLDSGLISSHNYAILDVRTHGSRRYVKLMNPWRTAAGIRPAIAISTEEERRIYADSASCNSSLVARLGHVRLQEAGELDENSLTFTLSWDDFCSHFDSLFLNWDPKLFSNNVTVHSSWRGSASASSALGSKQADPHFRLSVTAPPSISTSSTDPAAEVWLLLTRHITNTQPIQRSADGSQQSAEETPAEYIAIHAFQEDQQTSETAQLASTSALLLRKAKHKGAYVDGTHCLVRLKPSFPRDNTSMQPSSSDTGSKQTKGQCSFTVVVSRRNEADATPSSTAVQTKDTHRDVNYTLSVFSRYSMELSELRTRLPYCDSVSGAWTARTAGGNATLGSFMSNPQYSLVVPAGPGEVQLQVMLESSDRRIPVQVLLAYPGAGMGRVTHLTEGDVVLSSGMYHHGLALCCTSRPGAPGAVLRPGTYTLIASTFEAGMQDDFDLRVESTRPIQLKWIAQEGAGMFHRRLVSSWKRGLNACGSRANKAYFENPAWRFTIDRPGLTDLVARIKVEAVRSTDPVRPYIQLALFVLDEARCWEQVASSGAYTDLVCGAAIEKVRLQQGCYTLVASTLQPDTEAEFGVDLYTAVKVDIVGV